MKAMQAVFGKWADIQIGQLNRLLKPHGVKLQLTKSKKWTNGEVSITAHALVDSAVQCDHKFAIDNAGVAKCVNCGLVQDQPDV